MGSQDRGSASGIDPNLMLVWILCAVGPTLRAGCGPSYLGDQASGSDRFTV